MEVNESKNYKVYIPRLKQWVEVTKEQYYGYYRDIWARRTSAGQPSQGRKCLLPFAVDA